MIPTQSEMYEALCARHGEELQSKLSKSTVAIAGLGGLGSNIAIALARMGIGKLILVDFDSVDITNLNRQQYKACQLGMKKTDALSKNLLEIAPYINLEANCERVTEQNAPILFKDAEIICEAFDNAESKAMLVNAVLGSSVSGTVPQKYLVAASGMAGKGSGNLIKTRKLSQKFYLCGDGTSDVKKEGCLYASRVMLCAAHQANTVLRIIAGFEEA